MREEVPDEHALLPVRLELGPVVGDRRVEVELAAVGEDQRRQVRHRLGRRPDVDDRVALPRRRLLRVGVTSPHVGDELPLVDDRRRAPTSCPGLDETARARSRTGSNLGSHVPCAIGPMRRLPGLSRSPHRPIHTTWTSQRHASGQRHRDRRRARGLRDHDAQGRPRARPRLRRLRLPRARPSADLRLPRPAHGDGGIVLPGRRPLRPRCVLPRCSRTTSPLPGSASDGPARPRSTRRATSRTRRTSSSSSSAATTTGRSH